MSDDTRGECTYDPLIELMARFEGVRVANTSANPYEGLSVESKLTRMIVDGHKKGLEAALEEALSRHEPLTIINEFLLDGMKEVGELFGAGKMQLPFVLQSAETMKRAVAFLEPRMERIDGQEKGSILLATVAGDVHDIGKNLVDIILTNNGFRVVNLGIKQPIQAILDAAQEHRCQVIGMSGLLVKSTLVMRDNLLEMNQRGLSDFPVILGGAALTRAYVEEDLRATYQGRVFYAQDAFDGLRLMNELCGDTPPEPAVPPEPRTTPRRKSHRTDDTESEFYVFTGERSEVETDVPVPSLPFYGSRVQSRIDPHAVFPFINPVALFRGQWQLKKPADLSNPEFDAWLTEHAEPRRQALQAEIAPYVKPRVVWGYFPAVSEGNDLVILCEGAKDERARFRFPRQAGGKRLCLSDFFRSRESGEVDVVGFSLVTIGHEVSEYERSLFAAGEYEKYLYVHGLGVETAEALAEYWHREMRRELGIQDKDPDELKMLFSAKYQGARYSFGYPACPNLEDQKVLFELLRPERIGVELSEEFMLVPEQSTSAIVVHHHAAKYFNIR